MPSPTIESRHVLSCLSRRATKQARVMLWSAVLLACCGLSVERAAAQSFASAVNYPSAAGAQSVAVGDLNLDGKPDLAVANQDANNVKVLLGNGDGTFVTQAANYAVGSLPFTIVAGDFNRDGLPDLVVANYGGTNVSVLINSGGGAFNAAQSYTVGSNPISVVVGDFNGDGKLDAASSNQGSHNVSVLIGNGNGTFITPAPTYAVGSNPVSITMGDLNGDGKLDLATANNGSNNISLLIGNGNGTFITPAPVYNLSSTPSSVTARDLNGDGKPDLATANYFANTVSVLLNDGSGAFGPAQNYAVGTNPSLVAAGDFNDDGKPDLAASNSGSNNVSVLIGNGNGTFITPAPAFAVASVPNSVTVGDFNRDGRDDLVTANYTNGNVSVLLNTFAVQAGYFGGPINKTTGANPYSVAVGDFNSDGKPDLTIANQNSDTVSILLNNGTGTFAAHVDYLTGAKPVSVAVGDFNSDGKPDLAIANLNSDNVSVLLNNGTGTFAAKVDYSTGANSFPVSVAVGDFNNDGKPDLATANQANDTVSVFLNNGTGTFAAHVDYTTGATTPQSVAVRDFNNDGKPDLATANFNGNSVSVFLNTGTGTFAAHVDYTTGTNPQSVAVGDFNNDGKPDLATANFGSNNASVLFNTGTGTFAAKVDYPTGSFPHSVAVGDINDDGKPDLVTANSTGNGVSVLLNNGSGTFAAKVDYPTGSAPSSVSVGDFNVDGKPDLAIANSGDNNVSFLFNRAAAPTAATSIISGRVSTPDGSPLPGAVIQLNGSSSARTITDAAGLFRFDNLETTGFYSVTPLMADYTFGPAQRSFSLAADTTDAAFIAMPNAVITTNPLDAEMYFVRQQYLDFLGREPDAGGLDYWSNQISRCGTDQSCINARRVAVSAAFFIEEEYQQTGSFVYRLYKGALGRRVSYAEFSADRQAVTGSTNLDQSRENFADSFVLRAEFLQKYGNAASAESFVDALLETMRQSSAVDLSGRRDVLLNAYRDGQDINESRSLVLRAAVEDASFKAAEYNPSFVLMEYFGYLKREPEQAGYDFWLNVLNNKEPGNYRGMVCSFITSAEYQQRFSHVIRHSNSECGNYSGSQLDGTIAISVFVSTACGSGRVFTELGEPARYRRRY